MPKSVPNTMCPGAIPHAGQAGFTLVELMVVVAVIGVLAVVAVPSMNALTTMGRLNGATSELTAGLQLARAEAIRRNTQIRACPSDGTATASTPCTGSWSNWAILDVNETAIAEDRVLRAEAVQGDVEITGPANGILFRPSGLIDSAQNLEIAVSDEKRCLSVKISGVVSMSKGACP